MQALLMFMSTTVGMLAAEPWIRLGSFVAVFVWIASWEWRAPRRPQTVGRWQRWPGNLALVLVNTLLVRALFPLAAVGVAIAGTARGWGMMHALALPAWMAWLLGFLVLDFAIYLQHVLFHHVPVLWRLHRLHHADLEYDVTTGARFHPLEILLSMAIKIGMVAALGIPASAVLAFEVALNATAMFNHGNIDLPVATDRWLRRLVVTPDMHRVHHSVVPAETNSNYGFNFPWWDRLLGTYRAAPAAGQLGMTIGLDEYRDPAALRLDQMLLQPFRTPAARHRHGYPAPDD